MRTRKLAAVATAALTGSVLFAGVSPAFAAAAGSARMSQPGRYQVTVTTARIAPADATESADAASGRYGCCKS
jgi:hypothetical protein